VNGLLRPDNNYFLIAAAILLTVYRAEINKALPAMQARLYRTQLLYYPLLPSEAAY
jgi:hypothetical protein